MCLNRALKLKRTKQDHLCSTRNTVLKWESRREMFPKLPPWNSTAARSWSASLWFCVASALLWGNLTVTACVPQCAGVWGRDPEAVPAARVEPGVAQAALRPAHSAPRLCDVARRHHPRGPLRVLRGAGNETNAGRRRDKDTSPTTNTELNERDVGPDQNSFLFWGGMFKCSLEFVASSFGASLVCPWWSPAGSGRAERQLHRGLRPAVRHAVQEVEAGREHGVAQYLLARRLRHLGAAGRPRPRVGSHHRCVPSPPRGPLCPLRWCWVVYAQLVLPQGTAGGRCPGTRPPSTT